MAFLETDDARIYYEDTSGAGVPLVFMHPAAGSSASWEYQIPALSRAGYRCVTFDARGFGRSEAKRGEMGHASEDVVALAGALGLERFVLIAAAYGGFGGVDFALRFQERLIAFVLATSQGGIADPEYVAIRQRVAGAEVRAMPIQFRELGASYRVESPEGVERWLHVLEESEGETATRQETFLEVRLSMLESLKTPTLVLAADADLLAPPALMRLIAERIPGCEFATIADAGHSAHWERPDEWNRVVLEFLAKHHA